VVGAGADGTAGGVGMAESGEMWVRCVISSIDAHVLARTHTRTSLRCGL